MGCPFCGAVFGVAINYGAGVMANSLANHIRTQHPRAAFVVTVVGATVIAAVLYWLVQLLLHKGGKTPSAFKRPERRRGAGRPRRAATPADQGLGRCWAGV